MVPAMATSPSTIERSPVLDTLRTAPGAALIHDMPVLGAGLELGAPARGAAMGPLALRTAGLVRALADLGHRVSDRGTLLDIAPVEVAMPPQDAARCRNLGEIAGWTRA